jgi:hypothetical protein
MTEIIFVRLAISWEWQHFQPTSVQVVSTILARMSYCKPIF